MEERLGVNKECNLENDRQYLVVVVVKFCERSENQKQKIQDYVSVIWECKTSLLIPVTTFIIMEYR